MFGMKVSFFSIAAHFAKPLYRPFPLSSLVPELRRTSGVGAFLNRYLGLKPQTESYCPFLLRHPELRRTGRGRNRMLSEPFELTPKLNVESPGWFRMAKTAQSESFLSPYEQI